MGVGANMSGLMWVMEWTSVLAIILHISKKKKKKKNSLTKYRKTKRKSRAAKDHRQSKLFRCINRPENKLTIHLLDFYRHFLLNHEVRA